MQVDAIVIGGGPNGLVAANALVDAGWSVLLTEAEPTVGGAVRTAEVTAPGFRNDLFSAFYPLAAASPVITGLDLDQHGLTWTQAPSVLTHVFPDGHSVSLEQDAEATAAGLDAHAPGDGAAWLRLVEHWRAIRDPFLDALFTPFPPLGPGLSLLRLLGAAGTLEFARFATLPVRRFAEELFTGTGAPALLTGNAMHSDLAPDTPGSGLFGWLLCMVGQDVGFPVPVGGAQSLADALVARLVAGGGEVRTGSRVEGIEVRSGRARGVRLAGGEYVGARRAVLADVDAPTLFEDLVGPAHVPPRYRASLSRFQWDQPTLKLNWALSGPLCWTASGARRAGTVHLGVDLDGFVDHAADLSVGRLPRDPFMLVGQMTTADPTRSPAGTESAWAYTHLPRKQAADPAAVAKLADRVRTVIEESAPGFADLVLAEHVQSPSDLQSADTNLSAGAINAGTANLHQQLVFRPAIGLGRPETPVEGLFLAGASAHPGGGVHGACGWNAARAAIGADGALGAVRRRLLRTTWERLLR